MKSQASSMVNPADPKNSGTVCRILLPLALALGVGSPVLAQDGQVRVKIGVLAARGVAKCLEKWGPTAEYLTEQIPGHNYQPVHECLKELRIGPYKDFGKVTLGDAISQHWFWLVAAAALLATAAIATLSTLRLNRRLGQSRLDLARELAERNRAEQALRDGEHKYRVLLENLPQKIFSKDRNSIYVSCNENFARDLTIKPEEFAGKTDYDFFPAELADKYREDDKRVMESGKTEEIEEKYIQDGQQVVVHTVKTPVKDENGNSIGVLGIFWDITERKRAEEALQEESGRLRSLVGLLDTMDVGVTIQDRDYNVTYQNPFMQKQFGGLGEKCYKVYECHDEVCDGCPVAKAFKDGQPHKADRTTPAPGGGVFFWENTAHPIKDAAGKVTSCFEVVRNITERKRVEEQLQRYAGELEQANEEARRFTYVVSHDLRAPLVNLKGYSAELRSALGTIGSATDTALVQADEQQREAITTVLQEDIPEALDFIDSSVSRMDHFIDALLKLSRLGRRELELESIDVNALVQATLQTLAYQIDQCQVSLTVGSLPEVIANRTSMEQIMGNLLNNAVIYLDPSRPGEIEISAERSSRETIFRVRDNGRGIAQEDMDKVFAPFRRVGTQGVPGEGMGLSYVQVLVRRHGGRIWCESEPDVGTVFAFTISNHLEKGGDHA